MAKRTSQRRARSLHSRRPRSPLPGQMDGFGGTCHIGVAAPSQHDRRYQTTPRPQTAPHPSPLRNRTDHPCARRTRGIPAASTKQRRPVRRLSGEGYARYEFARCRATMAVGLRLNSSEIQSHITKFLKRNLGVAYCDDCIRHTLHFSRNQVSEQLMCRTASAAGLLRQLDDCSLCRVRRTITRAV